LNGNEVVQGKRPPPEFDSPAVTCFSTFILTLSAERRAEVEPTTDMVFRAAAEEFLERHESLGVGGVDVLALENLGEQGVGKAAERQGRPYRYLNPGQRLACGVAMTPDGLRREARRRAHRPGLPPRHGNAQSEGTTSVPRMGIIAY
jgi:hypothetical protein